MLVLSRKLNQEIILNGNIKISIQKIKGNVVRIGIEAPKEVKIKRGELASKDKETCPEVNVEEAVGFQLVPLSDVEVEHSGPLPVFDIETDFPETAQRSRMPKNRLERAIMRGEKSA